MIAAERPQRALYPALEGEELSTIGGNCLGVAVRTSLLLDMHCLTSRHLQGKASSQISEAQIESPALGEEAELEEPHHAESHTEDLTTKVASLEAIIDLHISENILLEKEINRLILCSADYKVLWTSEYRRAELLERLVPPEDLGYAFIESQVRYGSESPPRPTPGRNHP